MIGFRKSVTALDGLIFSWAQMARCMVQVVAESETAHEVKSAFKAGAVTDMNICI